AALTPTVKVAGVVGEVGELTSSQFTPLLVVFRFELRLKPNGAPVLATDTVCGPGGFMPISKLKVSPVAVVGGVTGVGLFRSGSVTVTTCGLLPPAREE